MPRYTYMNLRESMISKVWVFSEEKPAGIVRYHLFASIWKFFLSNRYFGYMNPFFKIYFNDTEVVSIIVIVKGSAYNSSCSTRTRETFKCMYVWYKLVERPTPVCRRNCRCPFTGETACATCATTSLREIRYRYILIKERKEESE